LCEIAIDAHAKALEIPRAELPADAVDLHDHRLVLQGRIVSAIRRARSISSAPHKSPSSEARTLTDGYE